MLTTGLENSLHTSTASTNSAALKGRTSWNIKSSTLAKNTLNRIRFVVESLKIKPNPSKPMIPLSIGKFYELDLKYTINKFDLIWGLILYP